MLEWIKCGCVSCIAGLMLVGQSVAPSVRVPEYKPPAGIYLHGDLDFINEGLDDIQLAIESDKWSTSDEYEDSEWSVEQDEVSCMDRCDSPASHACYGSP